MMLAILGRLKDRELGTVLSKLGFRSAEIDGIEFVSGQSRSCGKGTDREEDECAD